MAETKGIRWFCPQCEAISSEADLNNKFACPRCGGEQLTLLLEKRAAEWPYLQRIKERVRV